MAEALFDAGDYLEPDEMLLGLHRPSFTLYLRREMFVVSVTALAFLPVVAWLGDPRAWVVLPLVALVDLFVFDNLGDWQRNRALVWLVTNRRVIQIDTRDPLDTAAIPVGEIARLRRVLWWRLFVVGENRTIIDIAYVPGLPELRRRLAQAREALA